MSKIEEKVTDEDILKALQTVISKGSELPDDPEGGLSTVGGERLSAKAPKGKVVEKACDDMSSDEASDDGSDAMKAQGCKHVYKGQMSCKSCSARISKAKDDSSDDDSDDDSSDDGSDASKAVSKAIDAAEQTSVDAAAFMKGLVEQVSESLEKIQKSTNERFDALTVQRREFNSKMAQALVSIGNLVEGLVKSVGVQGASLQKAFSMPNTNVRPTMLSQREIVQSPLGGGLQTQTGFNSLSPDRINEWLIAKAHEGRNPAIGDIIMEWEVSQYNPAVFDRFPLVKNNLVADLCK